LPPLSLVQHDPERDMERAVPEARPVVVKLLDPWLVAHGRMRIGPARRRVRGIRAPLAVDMIQALGSEGVGLQLAIGDGPGRGYAAPVLDLAEVLAAQAEERRAVELDVSAHELV